MPSFKDEGNAEFKQGNFLRAAALYTKAIKEDRDNAVLFSNRSAAFLKLSKVTKALGDSDECIRLRPEWEKGYFRKGCALEVIERHEEALAAFQQAAQLASGSAPSSKEIGTKVRQLEKRLAGGGNRQGGPGKRQPLGDNRQALTGDGCEALVKDSRRVERFGKEILSLAEADLDGPEAEACQPKVYFLPGHDKKDEPTGLVRITEAFASPETYYKCLEFLREHAVQQDSVAACAVVPKRSIAYPQVWKRPGFPLAGQDGVFVQLESLKTRCSWFICKPGSGKAAPSSVHELSKDFKLFEPLFR